MSPPLSQAYWQHLETKEISLEEPGLHHYLPPHFVIPLVPKKNIVTGKLILNNIELVNSIMIKIN